jgi:GT2 family glycosyltransferase
MRLTKGKLLLRDIARRTLDVPLSPTKRGFSPPLAQWLRGSLSDQVGAALAPSTVRRRGIFDPQAVQRVMSDWLAGDARLVPAVMMLYCFETWAERWLDGPRAPAEPARARVKIDVATPDLSVVIVNWNTLALTRNCLASLKQHLAGVSHEVIVIDNDSADGSPEMIAREFPDVRLIRNTENVGFGVANNQAMALARGRWFLLLNSDTELIDDSVARLFQRLSRQSDIGVAHCRLQFPDGRLQHSVYRFPSVRLALFEDAGIQKLVPNRAPRTLLGGYWDYSEEADVDWVAGAFMLMPREVFEQTTGFDERLFMYGEDMEWCYRIRDRGWRIRFYPDARILHVDHASSEIRWGEERIAICLRRQRDIYAERSSSVHARALMAIKAVGAALRSIYYCARIGLGGSRGDTYRAHLVYQRKTLRLLLALALRMR